MVVAFTGHTHLLPNAVNSEIFASVLFSRNFVKIKKKTRNSKITLLFTDIGKPCFKREFLTSQICL